MPVWIENTLARLTLSQRFMLASLVILLAGMLGIGAWVERQVEIGVIHRTGATTALYVDSFVAPNLQELGQTGQLQPAHVETLSTLLQNTPLGQQIVSFRVWDTRGRLLYSTETATIGQTFPMKEGLLRARLGQVSSELSSLQEEENAPLGEIHKQLLETYSPVWLSGTNQVIAVAEFYQRTDELDREIGVLQRRSWLVVGLAILLIYLLLSVFVRRASDTIQLQQAELARKVDQLTGLLAQNQDLHARVRRASASVALLNENNLRRIGAELHDGPAQDLGLSLLQLDALAGRLEAAPQPTLDPAVLSQLNGIETTLQNALKEMRAIASGLSLPHLKDLSLPETIVRVVRAHERRTATRVELALDPLPDQAPLPVKTTVYRLIQEALNNAYRHAGGLGQRVHVCNQAGQLVVEVSDQGPGFEPDQAAGERRLGLSGMRERVESLGGTFQIESQSAGSAGTGTRLIAHLPDHLEGSSSDE